MRKTSWRELITCELNELDLTWDDVESTTLTPDQLAHTFDNGYGVSEGHSFTLWTKDYVMFPGVYDGAEWVAIVSRNPDDKPTTHVGGE